MTPAHIEAARQQGATDLEIHDTVLIAAAFCMYNRYVDGLATWQPRNDQMYEEMGKRLAESGYAKRDTEATEIAERSAGDAQKWRLSGSEL
ncbi:MAG TPA: hypothetical protein VGD64_15025 [Acidisarcina sp.]